MTPTPYEDLYKLHGQPFVHATQMEALAAYAVHPLHEEAKGHFFPMLSSRVAADYEV